MRNISNKITSMGKNLKEIAGKYLTFCRNSTASEENIKKPSEPNYGRTYEEREVNQSFMG